MKRLLFAILFCFALSLLAACGGSDTPPEANTPEPPAHNGAFVSEYGTMTFNGDGRTIVLDLSPELAEAAGLPEGASEGEYAFTFAARGECRYDRADRLSVSVDGVACVLLNCVGKTTESAIVLQSPLTEEYSEIVFERSDGS